jgi:ribosomal protein S18 acetylase RimI-like enzyme
MVQGINHNNGRQDKMELSNFIRFGDACWGSRGVLNDRATDAKRVSKRNDLTYMTLRDFIACYSKELGDYYGGEFWFNELDIIHDSSVGDTVVFCLVDTSEEDLLPNEIKKKIRKSGKWRRDKLKHQWSYKNPFNRIHGYIILKDVSNTHREKGTMSVSSVCSTYFTEKKGIGSDLMKLAKEYAQEMGCFDIVLEVANEFSGMAVSEESEEESEEEESDEEESDEEESDEEESENIWYPCESGLAIISGQLWKKCMRKNSRGIPTFNLEQEYIEESIRDYLFHEYNSGDAGVVWGGTGERTIKEADEPSESEYGGFWYRKGKKSQERLMKFYEMHGYKEDPEIHLSWGCFSEVPYPTMRLQLE